MEAKILQRPFWNRLVDSDKHHPSLLVPNLLKKLVYLYIINYSKAQPDLALMAINTFRKDSTERINPLVRALALRTMGCIRVDKITEYLCTPCEQGLVVRSRPCTHTAQSP